MCDTMAWTDHKQKFTPLKEASYENSGKFIVRVVLTSTPAGSHTCRIDYPHGYFILDAADLPKLIEALKKLL